jgi:hypothetical protein
MKIAIQKKIWWPLFLLGFGGTACLIVLIITALLQVDMGNPFSYIAMWGVWVPVCAISAIFLRRCYKKEPMAPIGFWHLNIDDLVASSLYVGTLLAIMKGLIPDHFLSAGLPFAIICGVAFVIGLLTAARAGIRRQKFFYALSCGMRLTGLFALGAAFAIMIMDGIVYDIPFNWIRMVLSGNSWSVADEGIWALLLHRMTLSCLPAGLVCFEIAKRYARREAESQQNSKALPSEPATFSSSEPVTPATARH